MYMKDIESDGASGRHFNFHIIHDGIERYNLHFKYVPPNDNCIYRWIATNYLDGEASKFELATPSYPEVDPPSFTASNAAQHFIWEISALTGTYGLNVETTHSALLLQMGDLLYQLAT